MKTALLIVVAACALLALNLYRYSVTGATYVRAYLPESWGRYLGD